MTGRRPRIAALAGLMLVTTVPARAADAIVVALLTNRTGPAGMVGTRVANGLRDYFELLDQRDGGIAGMRVRIVECEVASQAALALDCYAQAKAAGAVLVSVPDKTSTQVLALPSAADRIPLLSLADGFPTTTRGDVMPWVFNPSASVLSGITVAISHIGDRHGGLAALQGMTIGLAYSAVGADPSALAILSELAKRYGFSAPLFAGADDVSADRQAWDRVGRERPDYLLLLGQGVREGAAIDRALGVGVSPDRILALRWPDDDVLRRLGSASRGFAEVSRHAFGDSFPAFDEIDSLVIDRALSLTPKDGAGETHYNRGLYDAVVASEAIRAARKRRPEGNPTGSEIRRGLETLAIDDGRWKELGLAGFARALTLSCTDHGGHPAAFVEVWDGAKWRPASPPIQPMLDLVDARVEAAVAAFRAANPDWPARTEPCDQPT